MHRSMTAIALLISALVLTSCMYVDRTVTFVKGGDFEQERYALNYDSYATLSLDMRAVEVNNAYVMPMTEPHVEHLFPVPLYEALQRMFKNKLMPLGTRDTLVVEVEEASVVSEPLPVDISVWGNFKKEPIERLNARVKVRLKLMDDAQPGLVISYADVVAQRTKVLYENMTMEELDDAYFELTKELVGDIHRGMHSTIKQYFGDRSFLTTPK